MGPISSLYIINEAGSWENSCFSVEAWGLRPESGAAGSFSVSPDALLFDSRSLMHLCKWRWLEWYHSGVEELGAHELCQACTSCSLEHSSQNSRQRQVDADADSLLRDWIVSHNSTLSHFNRSVHLARQCDECGGGPTRILQTQGAYTVSACLLLLENFWALILFVGTFSLSAVSLLGA